MAVVLPSRRAGLHLQRHLARAHGAPLWSPDLLTPDGFLERLSGLREHPVHLTLLELHAVHRDLKGPAADDLHTVLGWAPTALHDMNEVDEHLLDRFSALELRMSEMQSSLQHTELMLRALAKALASRETGKTEGKAEGKGA